MANDGWLNWKDVCAVAKSGRRARRLVQQFGLKSIDGRRFHPGEVLRALEDLTDREMGGATPRELNERRPELG